MPLYCAFSCNSVFRSLLILSGSAGSPSLGGTPSSSRRRLISFSRGLSETPKSISDLEKVSRSIRSLTSETSSSRFSSTAVSIVAICDTNMSSSSCFGLTSWAMAPEDIVRNRKSTKKERIGSSHMIDVVASVAEDRTSRIAKVSIICLPVCITDATLRRNVSGLELARLSPQGKRHRSNQQKRKADIGDAAGARGSERRGDYRAKQQPR